MVAAPQPDPTQGGGAPDAGASPSAAPSQAPAPPEIMALARITQLFKEFSQRFPAMSAGLAKAAQGINEAQSAYISQPQPQSTGSTPPF